MSGWTWVGDHLPNWLMAALNFGMSYPKGDQDALFDLGDAWKQAAADLEKLEPDLKAVTGRLPQFYDSDGAAKVSAELATLFDGKDYSIQKLVECLNQLGHDTRATATEIEYAKIQSEIFALLTLYTVLQLSATLFGEALVPEVLLTARGTLRIFAEQVMERIGLLRARAALETLAKPLLREITVPLGEKLAAPLAEKVVAPLAERLATRPMLNTALQYGGRSIVTGLGAGAMGAGLDAGTQFIQILEGHRDDGFNLKQTFQTSLMWGVGGAVGAPFHAKVGELLKDTRLPSRLGGAIAGGVGGGVGAVGMYGTGLATQLYDNGGDWSKVDKTFHTELLIGGLAMGAGGGANHGLQNGHGAPGDTAVPARTGPDGSTPHVPEPEVRVAGEQPEHSARPEHSAQNDVHPAAATDQPVNHEPADATTRERDTPDSEAPRNDVGTNVQTSSEGGPRHSDSGTKLNDAGTKPGDTGPRPADTGAKPGDTGTRLSDAGTKLGDAGTKLSDAGTKLADTGTKLGESSPKVSDPAAPRAGTPSAPAGEGPRATTTPTEHRGNLVSGTQDKAAPLGRTPEARPVDAASATQTRATPAESIARPEQSSTGKPADRTDPTIKSPEADPPRKDPAPEGTRPEDSIPDRADQTTKEPEAQPEPREKPTAEVQRQNEHPDSGRPDSSDAAPETPTPMDSTGQDGIAPALVVTPLPGEVAGHEARTHSPDAAKSDARDNGRARAQENSKPSAAQDSHTPADPSNSAPAEGDWSPRPEDEWSHRDSNQVADELADRWGLEVSGFDHPLLDPEVAREFARAIDEMLTRYPDVDLRKVSIGSIGDPGTYAATYEGHSPSGRMYTDEVVLDRDYALDPERMAREIAEDEADGHLVPGSADRPIHSTLVHEFGHVLAIESQEHVEVTAYKALAKHFEATRGGMDKDAFNEWLDQLSGYSFDENGRFDGPEAVAEAFTDVVYHGEGATEPARVLYHHLLDSARDHGSTPDGFRDRPEDAIQDPRPRKGKSPGSSEPNGEREGPGTAPTPEAPEPGRPSAPDVESYLDQPRVSAALDRADERGVTTTVNGVDTPVSAVIRDLLPQHPELAELLRSNEHLERSLLARPKTLASLLTHPDGLPVLHDAVKAVAERGPESVLAEPVHIEQTPLTPAERAMSHEIRDAVSDVPESSRRQPEFDYGRIEDPEYQREFLRKQYDIWRASQDALNDVVRDIARETEGAPGWRGAPKDETRAWDKIKGYDGDVSRLTDLVGAKIVFDHVSDAYRALEMIENDPRVRIVEFEDRFDRPTPSGYRDLQMKVQLENGHIAELRLHLSHIDAVASYEHALYEVQRDFKALAKDENRAMNPQEAALSTELKRTVSGRFWEATQQGLPEEHAPKGQEPPERRSRARSGIPDEPTRDPGSTPPDPVPVTPREIESQWGIPEQNQRKIQAYAAEHNLVIEVRPTNPDSVRHLQDGAMPKPRSIKDKTISEIDVELGAPAEAKGLVGRFRPDQLSLPDERTVSPEHHAKLEDRYEKRVKDFEAYREHMDDLVDQGAFRVTPKGVVEGKFQGEWQPVTGDHDLYDILHADGRRLTPEEELTHRQELVERNAGIQHGSHVYWEPAEEFQRVRNFEDIVGKHQYDPSPAGRDNEPLVRFLPDGRTELSWASKDLGSLDREMTPWHIESDLAAVHERRLATIEQQSQAHFADKPDATPAERSRFENNLRRQIDTDVSGLREQVEELANHPDFDHAAYRAWLDDTFRTPIDVEIDGQRKPLMFIDRGKGLDPVLTPVDSPARQLAELRQELRNEVGPEQQSRAAEPNPGNTPVAHSLEEARRMGEQLRDRGALTPELRNGFEDLRNRAAEIDRAAADPARVDELTDLRERFAEQFDGLGLRDSENSGAMWQLFDRHDRALSEYLAEYSRDFLPRTEEAAPGHEQLRDGFEQLREHVNDIFAATNDPARASELPGLRAKFGELAESIGLRDQENWGTAWQSFKEHDAALATYVEQHHEHLLPRPEDAAGPGANPPAPEPIKQLAGYQGNFHQDAQDIVSALENAGRPDLAQKFTDLVNREVDGGRVGGLEDWMGETAPRARASDVDQVLDKAAELTELDRLSREIDNDPELSVRFNPGVSGDKSFDILVERTANDGSTTVERRVEIERMKQLPEQSSSLHGAALHGADKAVAPAPNRIPSAETTVVMPAIPPEGRVQPLGGGNERRFGADGWDYEIVDPNGNVRKTGNLLDELARSFTVNTRLHPNLRNLDAVHFVDENGNLLGQIVREGDGWRKVQ